MRISKSICACIKLRIEVMFAVEKKVVPKFD